jgi:hypothetical protein
LAKERPMTRPTPGIILLVTLLYVLVNVAAAADTVAITARQTVVRAGPDSKQRILATVPQGTTLATTLTVPPPSIAWLYYHGAGSGDLYAF